MKHKRKSWLILCALLDLLLCAVAVCADEVNAPAPKRVLLLHDYGQEAAGRGILDQNFQAVLRSAPRGTIEFYSETLELYRFPGESHDSLMHDYLRRKYSGIKIDVIVVVFDGPLDFVLRYRDDLFPGVPIVYLTLKRPNPEARPPGTTGLWEGPRVRDSLEMALRLQPNTEHVYVITGRLNDKSFDANEALEPLKQFESRVAFHYLNDLPVDELIAKVKNLPEHSIVLCPQQNIGVGGRSIPPFEAAALLAQLSNAPVYGIVETWIGGGIVGGQVVSLEATGAELAQISLRILNGARPEDFPVAAAPTAPMFDWRQLRRFNISEDHLPAGSDVRFREFTIWEQYRGRIILAAVIILVQALLILALLFQRQKRWRATRQLAESEREFSTLVENSPDVIARLDCNLRYIYVSSGLERAAGLSTDQFIGKTPSEIRLDGYDSNAFEQSCSEAIASKKPVHRAFDYGGRNYWTRVIPEFASDGTVESVMTISEDVTDRVRAEQELRQLTGQLFHLQDEERRRIARELHDGTAQNLFAISINLAKLGQLDGSQQQEAHQLITECVSLGDESLQEIRTLSYLLHPPLLDQVGLVSALQWFVEGFSKRSGIYVDVIAQAIGRLPQDVELALFRIVQESLANVRRHSGSNTASIRLDRTEEEVVLRIQDSGRGFPRVGDTEDADEIVEMGVGIPGMKQRLLQLGGKLEIDWNDQGTTVTAVVPLTNGASHSANVSRGR